MGCAARVGVPVVPVPSGVDVSESASEQASAAPLEERPAFVAFKQREDLVEYGDNGLLLFVAQLKLGFDDVDTFAANALTDDNNDKKCDLVALSADRQRLILAQGSLSEKDKPAAPANKASFEYWSHLAVGRAGWRPSRNAPGCGAGSAVGASQWWRQGNANLVRA